MEKFPSFPPKQPDNRLVNRGGRLVSPDEKPLEATATTGGLDFDPETGKPYEAVAYEGTADLEPKKPDYRLVRDKKTGRLVNPVDHPQNLEARAFYVDDNGDVISVPEIPKAPPPGETIVIPPTEKNASGDLHRVLAAAGLLEIVSRIPEHDRRHVKDIPVQDLADLALAKYLETVNMSSSLWKTVQSDDHRYLELRRQVLAIAQQVADNEIQQNLYVPKALTQMQMAVTQAAAAIMHNKE